jgi:hypothetical protein
MADVLSVIVGGAIGIVGSFGLSLWKERQSRLALRAAVRASISSILEMYAMREFGDNLQRYINYCREGQSEDWPIFAGAGEIREDPILHNLGDKVGLLGGEAGNVVVFTSMITGIDVDLAAMTNGEFDKVAAARRGQIFQKDLDLWNRAKTLGQDLMIRLGNRSWF